MTHSLLSWLMKSDQEKLKAFDASDADADFLPDPIDLLENKGRSPTKDDSFRN